VCHGRSDNNLRTSHCPSIMVCWLCRFDTTELGTDTKPPMCKDRPPCQICIAVTEVDEEINQAMAVLRRLMVKRRDLRSEHNCVHGTLIHRLPVELKNHIFELLLPSRDEWGEIPATERTVMSSYLNSISVCRGWRDIALSNPFLWSTMHIALRTFNSFRFNGWILRSQNLPVTLHLQTTDSENSLERSRTVLAFVFGQYSNRLRSFSFVFADCTIIEALQHSKFQFHSLTRLRIISLQSRDPSNQPLSLLNPTASPEKIELRNVSFRSLQISWNRLTSAKVNGFDLEDLIQLFQHASQMTFCDVSSIRRRPSDSSMPPIIHHKLKTLHLRWHVPPVFFDSLTLPCLQELHIFNLTQLPALVHRSSCPLTKLTYSSFARGDIDNMSVDDLRPLPGVTDLVVEHLDETDGIERLLLEGYFPDLRHLTLRPRPFWSLWRTGIIPLLLDRKRPRPDEPNEGRLHKFLVVDHVVSGLDYLLNSVYWEEVKALNISIREDGFEFL